MLAIMARCFLTFRAFVLLSVAALCGGGLCHAQRAMLSLDSSPDNRCTRQGEGGMWMVRDNSPRNRQRPESYMLTVTIRTLPLRTIKPYEIVRFLTPGSSAELGCSRGDNGANYQIVSEK
jgi:hypothetical protein